MAPSVVYVYRKLEKHTTKGATKSDYIVSQKRHSTQAKNLRRIHPQKRHPLWRLQPTSAIKLGAGADPAG